ncbi:MAG: leucine-rich repeat domain-containing protein [Spirochaetota bacterium]
MSRRAPRHRTRLERIRERFEADPEDPTVDLSGCELTEVPLWALERPLSALALRDNALRSLPEELGLLAGLRVLDVSHNPLEALPDDLRELRSLEELHLDHTRLTALPAWLAELPELQVITIEGMERLPVPEALGHLVWPRRG